MGSRRATILCLVVLALLGAAWLPPQSSAGDSPETYRSPANWSVTLPAGWAQYPKAEVDNQAKRAAALTDAETPEEYEAGFGPRDAAKWSYPYILVQSSSGSAQRIQAQRDAAQSRDGTHAPDYARAADKIRVRASALLSSVELGKGRFLVDRQTQVTTLHTTLTDGQAVRCVMLEHFGRLGIARLYFYALQSDFESQIPTIETLLDSLSFEDGFRSEANRSAPAGPKELLDNLLRSGLVFARQAETSASQTGFRGRAHWSVSLPADWEQYSKTEVAERTQLIGAATKQTLTPPDAAFGPRDAPPWDHAWVCFQEISATPEEMHQTAKLLAEGGEILSNHETMDALKPTTDAVRTSGGSLSMGKAKFLTDGPMSISLMSTVDAGGVSSHSIIVMCLGKYGLVTITFWTLDSEFAQQLPTFKAIVESFSFDQSYRLEPTRETRPTEAPSPRAPPVGEQTSKPEVAKDYTVTHFALSLGVLALFGWLLFLALRAMLGRSDAARARRTSRQPVSAPVSPSAGGPTEPASQRVCAGCSAPLVVEDGGPCPYCGGPDTETSAPLENLAPVSALRAAWSEMVRTPGSVATKHVALEPGSKSALRAEGHMLAAGLWFIALGCGILASVVAWLLMTNATVTKPWPLALVVLITVGIAALGFGLRQLRGWARVLVGVYAACLGIYTMVKEPNSTSRGFIFALVEYFPLAVTVAIAMHVYALPPRMFTPEYRNDPRRLAGGAAIPYRSPYFWIAVVTALFCVVIFGFALAGRGA